MRAVTLAIGADDYGLDAAIDRGVMQLAEHGRLNAVSAMVGTPRWPGLAAPMRALGAAALDLGLHLDLTAHPLDGRLRHPLARLVAAAFAHRLPEAALRAEIDAQFDRFEQTVGRPPDHVDGHQHVHQLPQVRTALLETLARRGLRPWLRETRPPRGLHAPAGSSAADRLKPHLIGALGAAALARAATPVGLHRNRHLLGVYGFDADEAAYRRWIEAWLAVAADDDLLMCHPADASVAGDPIAAARTIELAVLGSRWMGEALARHGVTLVRLGRVLRSTPPPTH